MNSYDKFKQDKSVIEAKVKEYTSQIKLKPDHRFASFDYCYNYFYKFPNKPNKDRDMEKSCLHLAYYLASWGMLRGSSFLLQKTSKYFQSVIEYVETVDPAYWEIDVDSYNDDNIKKVLELYENIKEKIIQNEERPVRHITLVSKILLGIFGFIPAYDGNFCRAFSCMANGINGNPKCGFTTVNKESLCCVKQFYIENKEIIDKLSKETYTIEFASGKDTDIHYPKAKIIDMYGFIVGEEIDKLKKALQTADKSNLASIDHIPLP
jgi:hypothetical protein